MIRLVIIVLVILILAGVIELALQGHPFKKSLIILEKPYKEYESNQSLERIWFDRKNRGLCNVCRMDDMPVLRLFTGSKCIWCAEFDNITYHLNKHGHRPKIEGSRYA